MEFRFNSQVYYNVIEVSRGGSSKVYSAKNNDGKYCIIKEFCPYNAEKYYERSENGLLKFILNVPEDTKERLSVGAGQFREELENTKELYNDRQQDSENELLSNSNYVFGSYLERGITDSAYIVTDTSSGRTLREWIQIDKPTIDEKIACMQKIRRAVYEGFHKKGYIHCDLKPDNIYVLYSGEIRILDIGSAYKKNVKKQIGVYSSECSSTKGFASKKLRAVERFRSESMIGHATLSELQDMIDTIDESDDLYSMFQVFLFMIIGETSSSMVDEIDEKEFIETKIGKGKNVLTEMILYVCGISKNGRIEGNLAAGGILDDFIKIFYHNYDLIYSVRGRNFIFDDMVPENIDIEEYIGILCLILDKCRGQQVCTGSIIISENSFGRYRFSVKAVANCSYISNKTDIDKYITNCIRNKIPPENIHISDTENIKHYNLILNEYVEHSILAKYLSQIREEIFKSKRNCIFEDREKEILRLLLASGKFGISRRRLEESTNKSVLDDLIDRKVVYEDAVRRGLLKINNEYISDSLFNNLDICTINGNIYSEIVENTIRKSDYSVVDIYTVFGGVGNRYCHLSIDFKEIVDYLSKCFNAVCMTDMGDYDFYERVIELIVFNNPNPKSKEFYDLIPIWLRMISKASERQYGKLIFDTVIDHPMVFPWREEKCRHFILENIEEYVPNDIVKCEIIGACWEFTCNCNIVSSDATVCIDESDAKEILYYRLIKYLSTENTYKFSSVEWQNLVRTRRVFGMLYACCREDDLADDVFAAFEKRVLSFVDLKDNYYGQYGYPGRSITLLSMEPFWVDSNQYMIFRRLKNVLLVKQKQYLIGFGNMLLANVLYSNDDIDQLMKICKEIYEFCIKEKRNCVIPLSAVWGIINGSVKIDDDFLISFNDQMYIAGYMMGARKGYADGYFGHPCIPKPEKENVDILEEPEYIEEYQLKFRCIYAEYLFRYHLFNDAKKEYEGISFTYDKRLARHKQDVDYICYRHVCLSVIQCRYGYYVNEFLQYRLSEIEMINESRRVVNSICRQLGYNPWECLLLEEDEFISPALFLLTIIDNMDISKDIKFILGARISYELLRMSYRMDNSELFSTIYERFYPQLASMNNKHLDVIVYDVDDICILLDDVEDDENDLPYSEKWQRNIEKWHNDLHSD